MLDEQTRKIYIEELPDEITQEEIQAYFTQFGPLEEVKVIREIRKKGVKKNFSFLLFENKEGLEKCMKQGN